MKDLYREKSDLQEKSPAAPSFRKSAKAYRILLRPLITEKAAELSAVNKYLFVVENSANKIEVARAIESVYGIKPEQVNIANVSGKKVRRGRLFGRRKDWKKAIVTLPDGKTINIYEGV